LAAVTLFKSISERINHIQLMLTKFELHKFS
jgi:hypothetical protein